MSVRGLEVDARPTDDGRAFPPLDPERDAAVLAERPRPSTVKGSSLSTGAPPTGSAERHVGEHVQVGCGAPAARRSARRGPGRSARCRWAAARAPAPAGTAPARCGPAARRRGRPRPRSSRRAGRARSPTRSTVISSEASRSHRRPGAHRPQRPVVGVERAPLSAASSAKISADTDSGAPLELAVEPRPGRGVADEVDGHGARGDRVRLGRPCDVAVDSSAGPGPEPRGPPPLRQRQRRHHRGGDEPDAAGGPPAPARTTSAGRGRRPGSRRAGRRARRRR